MVQLKAHFPETIPAARNRVLVGSDTGHVQRDLLGLKAFGMRRLSLRMRSFDRDRGFRIDRHVAPINRESQIPNERKDSNDEENNPSSRSDIIAPVDVYHVNLIHILLKDLIGIGFR